MENQPVGTRPRTGMSAAPAGAAIALVLSALVYAISETVTARAWSTPAYSYSENYISDLGNPQCAPYDGRNVCSPSHALMNWGFVAQGLLLACAVLLVGQVVHGRTRAAVLGIGAATTLGFALTGAMHSSPDAVARGTLWLHYAGATMAILGGNALAIVISRQWRRLRIPRAVGVAGVVLGAAGIVAALTWSTTFGAIPPGIPERAAVYAFVLWQLLVGGFVLHVTQPFRALLFRRSRERI
jgi:hypothetical membrane protein